ncbi:MAG: DMT family transporter, partial [Gammaproteobacteria bacterium]|nr:DMT family transporter [Gammaproteobacteria bacterium]
ALAWIAYSGVIVTLGGYGLYNYAQSEIDASKAAAFINLIPLFTLLLAFLILGENLSSTQLVACAIILLGVFITQMKYKKRKSRT